MTPGIIPAVTDVLKGTVKDWLLKDWACITMFHEMSLRPNLQYVYDEGNDVVTSFSDDGIERTIEVANSQYLPPFWILKALHAAPGVRMAKMTLCAEKTRELLQALIRQLNKIQLFVKEVVCNQGSISNYQSN